MPSPNSVFTDMVTTTLRNHAREVVDNVTEHNGFLTVLKEKDHIITETGGTEIALPLEWAENSTYQRYSGYDQLDISAQEVLTAAKYDWAQVAIHVTASGKELRQNNGPEAMIKLVKARIKNAKNSAANGMSVDLYSDGALTNQIGGLSHIIQAAGTGTVGGIDSSTYSFWQNQFTEMAGTGTWSASTILGEFNKLWLKTTRGNDNTDLIVSSHDVYSAFEASQQQFQRYTSSKLANAGFDALKYKGADVIFDTNSNFGTTAEAAFFVNTKYLYLVQHSEAQWTQDDEKKPTNQDAVVIPMYWMGNLVCSNRSLQGKLIDAA